MLANDLGEVVRGWEFENFLRWITFENKHVIPNSFADREPILIQMRERPSLKPPFQCRYVSLGDKTLSTGVIVTKITKFGEGLAMEDGVDKEDKANES